MPKGYLLQDPTFNSSNNTFSGTIVAGGVFTMTDQQVTDISGSGPITDPSKLREGSVIQFTASGNQADHCDACVSVEYIGTLSNPGTKNTINALATQIENNEGNGVGVIIRKG